MAITSDPSQKHAFLYTGNNDARWVADLKKVFSTLIQYYNYPASQVIVVSGDTSLVSADFPGATLVNVTTLTDLGTSLGSFITAVDTSPDNTIVLYFTGVGSSGSQLALNASATGETIDPTWLKDNCFSNIYNAFTHVIMQQGYSGGYDTPSCINNIGSALWTFTSACSDAETSGGNASGSFFTDAWISGLQFGITGGKHAYELTTITDPYPSPGGPGMMINMEQACNFAVNKLPSYGGALNTPVYDSHGTGTIAPYLGLPKLYIRDGNPSWWESPDIWLTRPGDPSYNGDLYLFDDVPVGGPQDPPYTANGGWKNVINIRAWNIGTHPVRVYSVAAELCRTGLGQSSKDQSIPDIIPNSGTTGILLPENKTNVDADTGVNSDVVQWNYPFYTGITHQCARGEVDLDKADLDFSWTIISGVEADIEAQRNLDPAPVPPPPPPPLPLPGGDEIPPEPENGTDAPGTGTDQGSQTFRGIKEHIYEIKNPFDKPRNFILQFPDEYLKHRKYLAIDWLRMPSTKNGKIEKLEAKITNNLLFLPFKLEKGESAQIKAKIRVSHKFSEMGEIRLPFNILVEEDRNIKPGLKTRTSLFKEMRSISGFTVVIWPEAVTLEGTLFAAGKKPLPKTKIRVETGNGQRWVNLITDKYGAFKLTNICPDTYRITVPGEQGFHEIHMVNMNGGKYRRIELHPLKQVNKK
jgi:hypothetical protein